MMTTRRLLGWTLLSVLVSVPVAACSSGGGSEPATDASVDVGADAPPVDGPTPDAEAQTEASLCPADATETACCCAGDVQSVPACGGDGALTCPAGMGLYHGADCSCLAGRGPCCTAPPFDASDAPVDGSPCVPPDVLRYETAGCGASAHPVCGSPGSSGPDVCAVPICSCDGRTVTMCEYAVVPWAHTGICQPNEGGSDAAEQ